MRQLQEEDLGYDEEDLEIQNRLRYYKSLKEEQKGFMNEHELRSRPELYILLSFYSIFLF